MAIGPVLKNHNSMSLELVNSLATSVADAGGNTADMMVLLETVAVNVIRICSNMHNLPDHKRDEVAEHFGKNVRTRLTELKPISRVQ